jgi:serine/threonine protein kinase
VPREEIPPDTLLGGKIRLIKRIGRGGMGDVWVARNESTQAELAVKTLQRSERTPIHDERFRREARLSATISHRNVVRVFDLVDEADGTLGLVMELLRGGTLEDGMRERGPFPTIQALAVALPVLSAMHHVHQKGIIHRDMKPANIFFAVEPDGHLIPKVLDFGIAKLPAAGSALTMDGSVLGTPHYMSPEQIRGQEDIDGRSDMFSFAVVLYEMLTGVRIFQRDTASASLAAVLEHEVDPDPRIEPRLWIAISRALSKRPYERFATCAEFAEALRASLDPVITEDDLAQALQDLQPRSELTTSSTTSASSVAVSSSSRRRVAGMSRRGPMITLLIAGSAAIGAAVFAVGLTLAVTGKSNGATPVATTATMTTAPALTTREIPPPPTPSEASSTIELPATATSSPTHARATTPAGPMTRRPGTVSEKKPAPPPPPPPPASSKPRSAGGVATTPGF